MGIGGSYSKGNSSSNGGSGGGGGRGRLYGLMLLLAFGAALVGVLILHKLRERRIFNLLLHDKHQEISSLHMLLQKERDYNKELKRKNEEMKAKIFSLRNHKMELDRKILEMLSTIDSLQDEQRTLEAAFVEKQNEIKHLKVTNSGTDKEHSDQVMALTERLKQKEDQIEALKHRLEYPEKAWSTTTNNDKKDIPDKDGKRVMIDQIRSENKTILGGEDNKEIKKKESLQDQNINYGGNKTEKQINIEHQVNEKTQNGNFIELENFGNSQLKGQEVVGNSKGENVKTITLSTSTMRDSKGKKWRLVVKNRKMEQQGNSRVNELTNMKKRRFFKVDQSGLKGRANRSASEVGESEKHDKNDFFGKSSSTLEEEKEEYKEEIDESEFN